MLAAAGAVAFLVVSSASARTDGLPQHSFVWPASGTITRPFGYDYMGFHPGVDIGTLRSLDVRAAAAGVVKAVGYATGYEGYGNIVLVNAGGGLQTLYGHLSGVHAKLGEHVVPGQLLGIAGCTGFCTGTHLHFEVRLHGHAINPMPLLPGGIPSAPAGPAAALRVEVALAARSLFAHLSQLGIAGWPVA
jgi:murein DD-endopeptidase MepM/ murein hydrolase activator NlpD